MDNPVHFGQAGDGVPVILVHGMAASLRHWQSLTPELARAGFETIALDLPGHGNSAWPEAEDEYHIEALYSHFSDWIGNLSLAKAPIMIAHSMGAYLGLQFAMHNPGGLRGLVLVSPYFRPSQVLPPVRLSLRRPELSSRLIQAVPAWTISSIMGILRFNGQTLSRRHRDQVATDYKRADAGIIRIPATIQDLTPRLSQIADPVVVVWGQNDLTLDPNSFPELVLSIPEARAVVIPDGGHLPHLTQTAAFNQAVLAKLDLLRKNGAS